MSYFNGKVEKFIEFVYSLKENRSTWANGWRKLRTLMPFLWPKKSFALQFRVAFCISLLIAGRFINVLVPIYNQKIGKLRFYSKRQAI